MIYEHRAIAERILGRPLKRNECVHHVNFDKSDNRHENLVICEKVYNTWLNGVYARAYAKLKFGGEADIMDGRKTLHCGTGDIVDIAQYGHVRK